ncbi:MAG: SDR family oxidoreductase [Rhodospirillaceae bacterium]|nr:SDR family oxidoreductase [Rhodospirillaceae bacterium]
MSVVLVTGADRGIGNALCRACQARGDDVIAACLEDSDELRALGIRVESGVDVISDEAVQGLAQRLADADTTIDLLINNAGIAVRDTLGALDYDAIRRQFEVNTLGPLRVTEALLERLKPGSTVAFITSRIGSLGDNHSGGLYGYRISKCAANMVAVNLAHDLAKRGVAAVVLHPGMVATAMTFDDERHAARPPEDAAAALIERIDRVEPVEPGAQPSFWHAPERTIIPW